MEENTKQKQKKSEIVFPTNSISYAILSSLF